MGKKLKWNLIVMSVLYLALGIFLLMVPGTALNVVCYALGGVVLLCGEYLFCGDTLFAGSIGRTDLEGGSSAQMAESLRKLAKLPIPRGTQVLPGHGEFSTFGDELDNNYFIRSAVRGNNDLF